MITGANGCCESYVYNDQANYVNVTVGNTGLTKQIYDGLGRLASTQRVLNGVVYSKVYTYDWEGKVSTVRDQMGNTASYRYDALGRLIQAYEPDGNTTRVAHNDFASWVIYSDESGNNRCIVRDRLGRQVSAVEEALSNCGGMVTNYYYDEVGNLLRMLQSNYNRVANPGFETGDFTAWSQTGMIVRTDNVHSGTYSAGPVNLAGSYFSSYTLSQNFSQPVPGSKVRQLQLWYIYGVTNIDYAQVVYTDGTHDQTSLAYVSTWTLLNLTFSSNKQILGVRVFRSSGHIGQIIFDDFLLSLTGYTSYKYDSLSRLIQTSYSDSTLETYSYDSNGNLVSKVDRNSNQTSYIYDSLNRVSSITYLGRTTTDSYIYDNNGNVLQLKSQNATLGYSYDSRSRVICETYSINGGIVGGPCGSGGGGSVAPGTLIAMSDGSTIPVQNLLPGMRLLSYNVTSGQFASSVVTRMQIVQTNNTLVIKTQDPEVLRTDNATIQKLWIRKANGVTGWFSVTQLRVGDYLFHALDQRWTMVTSIQYIPGSFTMYDVYTSAPYDYVADGYLDPPKIPQSPSTSTPSGIVGAGYSFSYYYMGDELTQITYNDNVAVNLGYDGLGRVVNASSIFTPTYNVTYARFSYYPNDQVKGVQYGNGLVANYTYDKDSRPLQVKLTNGTITSLVLNYYYTKTGTVSAVLGQIRNSTGTNVPISESYTYDPLQRLTNATDSYAGKSTSMWYEYDSLGNRIAQSVSNTVTQYSYNPANNELLNSTSAGSTTRYSYDKSGDQVSKTVGSLQWTYKWNVQGQLLSVSNSSGVQGYYAYDGLGRRVESKEGSSTTFYAYAGTETLADEYSSTPANDYIYADGLRIARVNGGQSSPTITYFHTDALGSTRLVTSSSRSILFSDCYLPYGQDNSISGSETYRFTGKPVSQPTGLYYEYSRWYDPSIGRFISTDPMPGHRSNPQSLNRYIYVQNSPLNNVDPSGLDCFSSLSSFGGCTGDFLYSNTVGAAVNSYNWYQGASDRDRWAFWAGVGTAVGIGLLVGVSCVVAACTGLLLLGMGVLAGVGGSFGAADAYHFAGGQSEGGLRASMFWGGIGGGAGFGAGELGASLVQSVTGADDSLVSGEIPSSVRATFEDCGEACLIRDFHGFQYGDVPGYPTHYITSSNFASSEEAITALKLPEYNSASFARSITIPKGTYVGIGTVRGGSATQLWVPNLESIIGGPWVPL